MLFRQQVKTVTHVVELPNFVQDRIRMHGVRRFPESLTARGGTAESSWAMTSFAAWVKASNNFELAVPPTLPIVTFRFKPGGLDTQQQAATHANIVDEVTRDGSRWISETLVKGESVLRMMVISYLTEERHLLELQSALTKAANNLKSQAQTKA